MARQLREDLLDQIVALQPEILVTSNIGCALHLHAGLIERGVAIEVVHPLVLLDRALN